MKRNIIEVNVENEINEGSVIVYRGRKWVAVDRAAFLTTVNKKLKELDNKITSEKNERTKDDINIKLELIEIKKKLAYILGEDDNEEEH
jgi:hypothetical protein